MNRSYATCAFLCLLLAWGCDDPGTDPASTAPPSRHHDAPSLPPPTASDIPVSRVLHNDPDAVRAYHEAMAAAGAAGGGGGGGGASPQERANYQRTETALRGMSDEEGLAMLQEMRTAAQQHDNGESPCDRVFAAFGPMAQHAGTDPMVSEDEFRARCERMPREMQACFKDEADQTEREQHYCMRMFGTTSPFTPGPRQGMGQPPGTPAVSPDVQRQVQNVHRRGR